MARRRMYEGKAKVLYEGLEPGTLIQHFKDSVTAFNNQKKAIFEGKGVLTNLICEFLYIQLGTMGIPTHLIRSLNMREQLIYAVEIIPLEVVVRNIAAGSLVKRLGLKDGMRLPRPLIEFYYKNDELGDPLVSEEHILTLGWASESDIEEITGMTLRINDFLSGLFGGVGLALVDMKLEFGRLYQNGSEEARIVLADEISPDVCRLRDINTQKIFDKDIFRTGKGNLIEAYREVAKRLGIGKKG